MQVSLKFDEILLVICATNNLLISNLGQNIAHKVSKLSKITFSMNCLTPPCLKLSSASVKMCLLVGQMGIWINFQVLTAHKITPTFTF